MVTIWHNPRCSKSRQTLQLLQENGVDAEIFHYLKSPLSVRIIEDVLKRLDMKPENLIRKGEPTYKELTLKQRGSDQTLIEAMVEHPILVERPIVIGPGGAAIGRPPEAVLSVI